MTIPSVTFIFINFVTIQVHVIPAKAGIHAELRWIPDQVGDDKQTFLSQLIEKLLYLNSYKTLKEFYGNLRDKILDRIKPDKKSR